MSKIAKMLIHQNKRTKETFLDLGNCGLKMDIPKELYDCTWLERLNLGSYYFAIDNLTIIKSQNKSSKNIFSKDELLGLEKLINLQTLDLQQTQIADISFLLNIISLQRLDLSDNQISDISGLTNLKGLTKLNLNNNQISDISQLASLTNLQILYLRSNKISDISCLSNHINLKELDISVNKINDIGYLAKLINLNWLHLGDNEIVKANILAGLTKLEKLYIWRNNILDFDFLKPLQNLQTLALGYNNISDISFLANLTKIQSLFLNDNFISDFRPLENLSELKHLNLDRNEISDIYFLEKLTKLRTIDLSDNKISDIKPLLVFLENGYEIKLHDILNIKEENLIGLKNNLITNPPFEIVKQGSKAVIEYFKKIEVEGIDYIYEAKMTLVGDGGSGKTSLQNRIIDKNSILPKGEERTRGIKISEWHFKDKESIDYTVNIWDFGGQDVYYPVHRFFLTENSVYLLMASTRILSHNFEYWIPTIYQFGNKSPIILVQNCHDSNRSHWNDLDFFYGNSNFNIVKPYYELNLPKSNEGLKTLENAIEQQIVTLPHIGKTVPKSWVKVRATLSERKKTNAYISYEKFIEICQEADIENFKKLNDINLLGRFLADLGIILWYHDKEYLKDWIILQPQWAMNAVYKIIDDEEVQKCGIIYSKDFIRLWNENDYQEKSQLLKKMLLAFKIAFPKKHPKDDFILPARLTSLTSDKRWTNIDKTIRLEYTFNFMPRGIVNQLSAELSRQIKSDSDIWNNAVNFEYNKSDAQVEEDYFKRVIYIKANGNDARSLVVLIMESIENILQDYKGVKPSIQVPCNCEVCQNSEVPTFFSYIKLFEWLQKKTTVVCNESSTVITIQSLLYNIGFNIEKDRNHFDNNELGKQRIMENDKINIEFKPEININPTFTNTQTTSPIYQPEQKKEEKKEEKIESHIAEEKAVRKWKMEAIWWFLIALLFTFPIIYIYVNELELLIPKKEWKKFKISSIDIIGKASLTGVWLYFIYKMLYERFLDSSKEKSFRDLWKSKKQIK